MKDLTKKVSVVIPNYNYGRYLWRRVKSILNQTYPIYELIIMDDASTDDSLKVIDEIELYVLKNYPKVKLKTVTSTKNSGKPMAQWRKGVGMTAADSEFVWIAEADDSCDKNFLAEAMKAFDDPKVVVSYTESKVINSMGLTILPNFRKSRDKEGMGHFNKSYVRNGKDEICEIMAVRCTIPNVSGVVFRRSSTMLRTMDEALRFKQVGDWYLYARLLEDGKIAYSRKALNKFRIHRGSATKRGREHYDEVEWMHKYFKEHYNLSPKVLEWMMNERKRIRAKYGIMG